MLFGGTARAGRCSGSAAPTNKGNSKSASSAPAPRVRLRPGIRPLTTPRHRKMTGAERTNGWHHERIARATGELRASHRPITARSQELPPPPAPTPLRRERGANLTPRLLLAGEG